MKIRKLIIKIAVLLLTVIAAFYAGAQYAQSNVKPDQIEIDLETSTPTPVLSESSTPEPIPEPTPSQIPEKSLYKVTAYCPCAKCCGKSDGITARESYRTGVALFKRIALTCFLKATKRLCSSAYSGCL